MRIHISAALVALLVGPIGHAEACSEPETKTFKDSLESATSVFIFRLDEAQYKRGGHSPDTSSVWTEGRIKLVQNLYGDPTKYKRIKFSTSWCGGITLVVGRHYLIAASASGDTIELARFDRSLYDIEGFYNTSDKKRSLRSPLVLPVIQSIYGAAPLPAEFPSYEITLRTVILAPPPAGT